MPDRSPTVRWSVPPTVALVVVAALLAGLAAPALAAFPPPPTNTTAVIEVFVGGDRTADGADSLDGVTLQLYDGPDSGPTTPVADSWATCVSSDGSCFFVVPDTQVGGANNARRFWIQQAGTPPGWFGLNALAITPSSSTSPPPPPNFAAAALPNGVSVVNTPYRFLTPPMRGRAHFLSGFDFMDDFHPTNGVFASSGAWQISRDNPPDPATCGRDIALILDLSVASGDPDDLKTAATDFIDALEGTPSRVALFNMTDKSPAVPFLPNRPATSVSTDSGAETVRHWIDQLPVEGGTQTNWDAGLFAAAQDATTFDEAVLVTDRPPTNFADGQGSGDVTRFKEDEYAIFSANVRRRSSPRPTSSSVPTSMDVAVTPAQPGGTTTTTSPTTTSSPPGSSAANGSGSGTDPGSGTSGWAVTSTSPLARTGGDAASLVMLAGALLAAGVVLIAAARPLRGARSKE